jgi:hypothetical protein
MVARQRVARGHTRLPVLAMLVVPLALACSPRDADQTPPPIEPSEPVELSEPPPPQPPPEQHEQHEQRELEPALPPTPGRYASKVAFSGWFFIHTEARIDHAVSGTMVLQLHDDGRASACAGARETGSSSVGDYAGNVEYRESDHSWIHGLTGTWSSIDSGFRLRFDRIDYSRCEVAPDRSTMPTPLEIDCTRLAANTVLGGNAVLPGEALRCEVSRQDRLASLALLLGDPPRAWGLRELSPGDADPVPEQTNPSLLLGADPGIELTLVDGGSYQPGEPLRITATKVTDPVPTRQ